MPTKTRNMRILWIVATIVIVIVVGFFVIDAVTNNPLEGEWFSEDYGYSLDVDDDEFTLEGTFDGEYKEIEAYYTIDKQDKVVTIKPNAELSALMDTFATSYDYSIEKDTLTLIEREYGDKFIFTRIDR